ncbi:Ni Fe-hydrogenase III large subunit-like protein [Rubrobacter xylanophilus DSM 9941]|uniref:Ni Fe-hydrogenase III large subunit-like protein n=1 Tax=Rubrobacter xylanophilus (strain DSM 9941 / JCM 11954 / NBRC 16129 / PRD-1) TaxID=266117 RepID=Q1AZS0_RUBXD|nr:heavy metal-binding domain-containing protein [Rubrobacter xylanophilus]ABG03108.1 Ni Fe-hydrogenase III large subunit-like protein [Rubrobacter xylanophilus DSM 9941]
MISGARQGSPAGLRRLFAAAMARDLRAFVVPGAEVARARGLDVEAAGLGMTGVPRHASVLLVVGELPAALRRAAAVVYAQMMRPRAVLAAGAGDLSPLPGADVSVGLSQEELEEGVARLRTAFARGAFAPGAAGFEPEMLRARTEYACPMHPEVVQDEPGACPKCGMELVSREAADGGSGPHHGGDHGGANGDHGHGGHGHGGMGFMSMVEMTKDLPRSSDGLPMEWVEAPFGPLFPGLPGGLFLKLTLDGDTVAEASPSACGWASPGPLTGPADALAERLAGIDPLSPASYRVLALRAVEDAAGAGADERTVRARAGALERERAASHLGWLSGFAYLIGHRWLARRAAELQLAVLRAEPAGMPGLRAAARSLARRIERTPLLARRLEGIGALPGGTGASGPVARAAGVRTDARCGEGAYRALGFEPVVREGGDALARLRVRLAEIEESLGLAAAAGSLDIPAPRAATGASGAGAATVETPRGTATLRVALSDGEVVSAELEGPSARHLALVGRVAEQRELADALVGVASLDLSPWETAR